jgi:hypothetical protein
LGQLWLFRLDSDLRKTVNRQVRIANQELGVRSVGLVKRAARGAKQCALHKSVVNPKDITFFLETSS